MIPSRLFVLLIGLVFCVPAQLSRAQNGPPKPAKLRFLFIDESPGRYSIKLPSGQRQLGSNPYEISTPVVPDDFKPLEVFKELTDPKSNEQRPVKIATVAPPADTPSALIIITPRPPASPDVAPIYQVEVINTDPNDFPAGSIRIINRSPVAMAGQFNGNRIVTNPGETNLVQPDADTRNRILYKIAVQVQKAGGWSLISNNVTVIRPPNRMVGVLVYSPGGMRHTLTDAEIAEFGPPKPGCFWLTFSDRP